ncbi:hypothetical protein GP486_007412 [Trichoglossum hirsutum]|uniref:Amine oxidase n=1 Tax=Trichoglossum hirsutum TaxID=265104 RepID=A0A9P8IFU6_9PEZI|nr:hypothetical protein GP486_007412 [Trichoglossum hirsutum]
MAIDKLHEAIINLSEDRVESNVRLGPEHHGSSDAGEIFLMERIALEDEGVKAEIAKLQLPPGTTVIGDPWIYGSDGLDDERRQYQCFLYVRYSTEADSNYYAFPIAISPVIDVQTEKVTRIDILPTSTNAKVGETQPYLVRPANDYIPEAQKLRIDLKALNVVQPEGASFRISQGGQVVDWQKWRFRIGFNQREGMVLYDVNLPEHYLFYRLSLSEISIPYADPRHPFHKKAAFDLGDCGAGVMANNLKLGCDCLGSIYYLSGVLSNNKGEAVPAENVVCIHEQDAGIGWKHTNYRTNRAVVVRSRELVLQSIITVANYEYILAFVFNQAGEVSYEVRATGILSTQPIDDGTKVPWGTVVHPGVLAAHHQHIFSLRVDPALDGHDNRLVYEEAHAMPRDVALNPHGIGYVVKETVVEESGGFDLDHNRNRTFKIQNAAVRNPVNGMPVAYKIQAPPFQKILADKDSFHCRRIEFADHSIYVTKYKEDEHFAAGKYTNQSRGGNGLRGWVGRKDNVKDTDIVVWVQFGINHIPRIEDFPVMPCEITKVTLKPVNFFDKNPALDVPPSEQALNRSTLISEASHQPTTETRVSRRGGGALCSSKL